MEATRIVGKGQAMAGKFTSIWGKDRRPRLFARPAAASGFADTESGNEGDNRDAELRALDVMFERGLIDEATYQTRRAEILEAEPGTDGA